MATASSSFTGTESPLSEGGVWSGTSAWWQAMRKANGAGVVILANDSAMRYTGTTFTADQFSEITVASIPTGGQLYYNYVFVRMNATAGCYLLTTANDVGANILQLWRLSDAGAYTQIGTDITANTNIAANDVLRIQIVGTSITCKQNGATVRTATDSTFSTGQPAMGGWVQNSGSNVLFNSAWSGGDVVAAASGPPIRARTPSYLHSL